MKKNKEKENQEEPAVFCCVLYTIYYNWEISAVNK